VRKFLRYWLPVVAWLAAIFLPSRSVLHAGFTQQLVSSVLQFFIPDISLSTIALVHTIVRNGAHMAEYSVLSFLLWRALRADAVAVWRGRWAAGVFLLALGVAKLDAFH